MKRRNFREHVFRLVYLSGFYPQEEVAFRCEAYLDRPAGAEEDLPGLDETDREEIGRRAAAVIAAVPELDERLNRLSEGWKTGRMSRVDLALLRLAAYEILYDPAIPVKVSVNEAVELAKTYGGEDSPAFVNAILGKLLKEEHPEIPTEQ